MGVKSGSSIDVKAFDSAFADILLSGLDRSSHHRVARTKVRRQSASNLGVNLIDDGVHIQRKGARDLSLAVVNGVRDAIVANSLLGVFFGPHVLVSEENLGFAKGDETLGFGTTHFNLWQEKISILIFSFYSYILTNSNLSSSVDNIQGSCKISWIEILPVYGTRICLSKALELSGNLLRSYFTANNSSWARTSD